MKIKYTRTLPCALLAAALAFSAVGCSSGTAASAVSSETASSEAASSEAASSMASFDHSSRLDESGLWEGVTATDYVTLPDDWESITIPAELCTVSDEDMDAYLKQFASDFSTSAQVTDRAVEDGDTVNIDYVGSVGGVEFTGGSTGGSGTDVTAGSTDYIDDFLTQIIGHKPGETINVEVTFPDGYSDSTDADGNPLVLANQDAVFVTTINYISETTVPEMSDELVAANSASLYDCTTVQELKDYISEHAVASQKYEYIVNYLVDNSTYSDDLPASIREYEEDALIDYYSRYAAQYSMDLDTFLTSMGVTGGTDGLLETSAEDIKANVKQSLVLQAVVENLGSTNDDAAVGKFFEENYGSSDYSQYATAYGEPFLKMTVANENALQQLIDNSVEGK